MKEHGFDQRPMGSLRGRDTKKVYLFTDTETHNEWSGNVELQKFTLGWIFLWKSNEPMDDKSVEAEYFNDPVKYCRYIELMATRHKKITVVGHNIFFDLQCAGFFKYFTRWGWSLEWIYDKGLTYILQIVKKGLKLTAISSTNYYDCSLRKLGEMIHLEKEEISFKKATLKQLKAYCYRDTEIVMHAMWYYMNFILDNSLGRVKLTKSSQALSAYRTRFMDKKICMHSEERAFDLERAAYLGGRTEAFRIGAQPEDDFVILDVNGMYPYVMKKYKYPSKMVCLMEGEETKKYTDFLGSFGMIAEVEIETPEPVFGVHYHNKLIFPTGQFRAFLCTEALRYAVKKGYVKKFVRCAFYLMEDLFTQYVDYFQEQRENYRGQGNDVMDKLCKYMHNTLYGKWAARDIVTDIQDNPGGDQYDRQEIWDAVHGGWWIETKLMNKTVTQFWGGESYHSFPAIAAHVTENARMELWEIIRDIGRENVLYCDTDSVIIHASDMDKIRGRSDDSALGSLKIQSRFSKLTINGAKNYRTDQERHIKGIPIGAEEVSPGIFRYDSFQRQASCMKVGQIIGVQVSSVTRRLTHKYDKGEVGEDGVVTPYHFAFFEPLALQPPPF